MKRFELACALLLIGACNDQHGKAGAETDMNEIEGAPDAGADGSLAAPDAANEPPDGGAAQGDAQVPAIEPRAHVVFTSASEREGVPELWAAPLDDLSQVRRLNPPIEAYDPELKQVLPLRGGEFAVMTATLEQGAAPSLVAVRATDRMQLTLGSATHAAPQVLDDDATVLWLDHEGVIRAAELGAQGVTRSWVVDDQLGAASHLITSPTLRKAAYVRCEDAACELWVVPDVDHPEPQLVHGSVNADEVFPAFALDGRHLQFKIGFQSWLADASVPVSARVAKVPSGSRLVQGGKLAAYFVKSEPNDDKSLWRAPWDSDEAEQVVLGGGVYSAVVACAEKIFIAAGAAGWVLDANLELPARPLVVPSAMVDVEWLPGCAALLATTRTADGLSFTRGPVLEVEGPTFGLVRSLPLSGWLYAFRRVPDGAVALHTGADNTPLLLRWQGASSTPQTKLLDGLRWPQLSGVPPEELWQPATLFHPVMSAGAEPGTWDLQTLRMPASAAEDAPVLTKLAGPTSIEPARFDTWGLFTHSDWMATQGLARDASGELVWTTHALDLRANTVHDITPRSTHSRGGVASVRVLSRGRVLFTAAVDRHHFPELFSVDVERQGAFVQQTSSERLRLLGARERQPRLDGGGSAFGSPDPAVDYQTVLLAETSDRMAYLTQSGWATQPLLEQGESFSTDKASLRGDIGVHAFSLDGKAMFYSTQEPLQLWYEDLESQETRALTPELAKGSHAMDVIVGYESRTVVYRQADAGLPYYLTDLHGATPQRLEPEGEFTRGSGVTDDHRWFLFVTEVGENYRAYAQDLTGLSPSVFVTETAKTSPVVLDEQHNRFYFLSLGTLYVSALDALPAAPRALAEVPGKVIDLKVSGDGTRVAVLVDDGETRRLCVTGDDWGACSWLPEALAFPTMKQLSFAGDSHRLIVAGNGQADAQNGVYVVLAELGDPSLAAPLLLTPAIAGTLGPVAIDHSGSHVLHAWSSEDPTQTGAFVTRLDAPGDMRAVLRGHPVSSALFTAQ